jgi:Rha family phage regulatory protein
MNNNLLELGITERQGKVTVSSRDVARVFEKRHDHVLRDIKNIIDNDGEWGLPNFGEMSYKDSHGRQQSEYAITRDGFTILAMGYSGDKAMRFKKAYITAFNEMERTLIQEQLNSRYDSLSLQIEQLSGIVKELAERNTPLRNATIPGEIPALPETAMLPGTLYRRRWFRTAGEKLELLTNKTGLSRMALLRRLYELIEEKLSVSIDEEQAYYTEAYNLDKCSGLEACFYSENIRTELQALIDFNLAPENRGW